MNWANLLLVIGVSLLGIALLQTVTAIVANRIGKLAVVDIIWPVGFAIAALVGLLLGEGDLTRRIIVAIAVWLWTARLATHLARRSRGKGEDPRYVELYSHLSPAVVNLRVFGLQGLLQWIIAAPIHALAATEDPWSGPLFTAIMIIGVVLWAIGFFFEAVGDLQLTKFKANPENKGKLLTTGLWAWTRHPNYFGNAAMWWGLWLIAAVSWPALATIYSPLIMTFLLVRVSGAALLEKSMSKKPGWDAYAEKTPMFIPRPPK